MKTPMPADSEAGRLSPGDLRLGRVSCWVTLATSGFGRVLAGCLTLLGVILLSACALHSVPIVRAEPVTTRTVNASVPDTSGRPAREATDPELARMLDLVTSGPDAMADQGTRQRPNVRSTGIKTFWVNGKVGIEDVKSIEKNSGPAVERTSPGSGTNRERQVDEFIRYEMARQQVPGVAIAIVTKSRTTAKGYGFANVEHRVPVTDETIFQSGSVGKMFTATIILLLVEEGRLSLSDSITKFFPDAPTIWREISVRHLLTHTSGLPDYTTSTFDYRQDYTEDQFARFVYQQPLEFSPGSRWNYSNTGYVLLGLIIHKVSGKFYGDVLAERVFKPLGMKTARIISEADIVPNRAAGYQLVKDELKNQDWVAPKLNTTADGSLYWSLRDLLVWNAAVQRRAILKPESWEQMLTPVRLRSGKTYPYGMGWFLEERNGKPLEYHTGSQQGFKAQLARFTANDLDIIVLANLAEAEPMRFVNGIAAILDPSLAVKPPEPIEDQEPEVKKRLGRLLDAIREGNFTRADFPYVRAGFFPDTVNTFRDTLAKLGKPSQMQLYERKERGDDRVYLYKLSFETGARYLNVGLAPDDGVSTFSLKSEP